MKFEIKNRWTGNVQWTCELEAEFANKSYSLQLGAAVKAAYKSGADLRGADLRGGDLRGADLSGADLRGADLRDADLSDADLRGADLSGADLRGADLRDADLRDADLRDADLSDADLSGADLSGADLSGADLRDADLRDADLSDADLSDADLSDIRVDFFDVLLRATSNGELPGLIAALKEGRVDGSQYEGACACLIGTIANVKHCKYNAIPNLTPDASRPAEQFFVNIRKGDTPETNQCAKLAVEWAEEFQSLMAAAK
jgi:uncharacterized protein YjbI with pentapeptide repeats